MGEPAEDRVSKATWRTRLVAGRLAVPAAVRHAEATALVRAVTGAVTELSGAGARTVCGYVPVGSEPGSVELLDTLAAAGHRVLLPVVAGAGPLDWAEYTGVAELVAGPYRLRQPAGARLGPDALGAADVVLVPALAVDRRGVRLGRGAGYYDRSLPLAGRNAALVAVVRDEEVVGALPAEPHDVRVTAALTPDGGLLMLPGT